MRGVLRFCSAMQLLALLGGRVGWTGPCALLPGVAVRIGAKVVLACLVSCLYYLVANLPSVPLFWMSFAFTVQTSFCSCVVPGLIVLA
jgi:hypothetical protein